jgi:signal transduction histidine kinase
MLDYQKLSSGSIEMNKEENNIEKILNDALASFDSEFKQKGVEKMIAIEGNAELICDTQRISQVLTALLDNSLKAIQPKLGKINVSASQLGNTITVSVSDNGCGIPKDQLDKVFSKFYQVDMSNTREKGGVGLGLSICQKIIDAHDGKIWIESELSSRIIDASEQVASSSALVGVAVTACLTSLVRIEFIHQHGWTRFLNTTLGTNDVE